MKFREKATSLGMLFGSSLSLNSLILVSISGVKSWASYNEINDLIKREGKTYEDPQLVRFRDLIHLLRRE